MQGLLLYIIIFETGPTIVGDEHSDRRLMTLLVAEKFTMLGNNFSEYRVNDPPRLVLDKLETIGYHVVSMTGVGQTIVWCLHKPAEKPSPLWTPLK
uniref:GTP cyclohydrolase 1 feedback regulatory protein n=1 Tax=Callorhinchus milii TaxID=7868 RepID=A0A4W3JEP8_CALMI